MRSPSPAARPLKALAASGPECDSVMSTPPARAATQPAQIRSEMASPAHSETQVTRWNLNKRDV